MTSPHLSVVLRSFALLVWLMLCVCTAPSANGSHIAIEGNDPKIVFSSDSNSLELRVVEVDGEALYVVEDGDGLLKNRTIASPFANMWCQGAPNNCASYGRHNCSVSNGTAAGQCGECLDGYREVTDGLCRPDFCISNVSVESLIYDDAIIHLDASDATQFDLNVDDVLEWNSNTVTSGPNQFTPVDANPQRVLDFNGRMSVAFTFAECLSGSFPSSIGAYTMVVAASYQSSTLMSFFEAGAASAGQRAGILRHQQTIYGAMEGRDFYFARPHLSDDDGAGEYKDVVASLRVDIPTRVDLHATLNEKQRPKWYHQSVSKVPESDLNLGSSGSRIGCKVNGSERLNGYIYEILAFQRALTDEELRDLSAYLADKWDIRKNACPVDVLLNDDV